MIRNLISLSLLLFSFLLNAQIIKGKIHYTISIESIDGKILDSITNSATTKKVNMGKWTRDFFKGGKDVTGNLSFFSNESLYALEDKMDLDNKKTNITRILAGGNTKYYVNTSKKEYFKQVTIGEVLRVKIKPLNWQITQQTKTIGDYNCYKAITTKEIENSSGKFIKKITAWFAPSIPVNFGPNDYFGLPGLILEVIEDKKSIKAKKIELNSSKKIKIDKPTKGKLLTKEEYSEMGRNFFKNLDRRK